MIVEVIALVLLPLLMFGAAWALASARQWRVVKTVPRAVRVARAMRTARGTLGTRAGQYRRQFGH